MGRPKRPTNTTKKGALANRWQWCKHTALHKPQNPQTKQNPNAWLAWQQNHHAPTKFICALGGCAGASHTQGLLSPKCPLAPCMALSTTFGLAPPAKDMAHHVPVPPPKALQWHQILGLGPNLPTNLHWPGFGCGLAIAIGFEFGPGLGIGCIWVWDGLCIRG